MDPSRSRRLQDLALPAVLAAGFLLRVWAALRAPIVESDGVYYARLAASLLRGDLDTGLSAAWPPLLPVLTAGFAGLASLAGVAPSPDLFEACARAVSVLAGTLTLLTVARLARTHLDARGTLLATAIAAFHPRLIQYSGAALTEALFAACLAAAVAALARRRDAVAGVALGLSYLARPEGAWIAFALWAAGVAAGAGARGPRRLRPALMLGFVLVAAPYALVATTRAGHFTLGEKGAYNFWRAYRAEYARHYPEPRGLAERVNESPGVPRLATTDRVSVLGFVVREPGVVLARTSRNLVRILAASYPGAAYAPIALLAVAGLWGAALRAWWPILTPLAVVVLLYAPLAADRRFFVPALPLLAVLAARGFLVLEAALARRRLPTPATAAGNAVAASLLAGSVLYFAFRLGPIDDAPEHEAAGRWLASRSGAGVVPQVVMSRKPWVAFYSGGLVAELPEGSPEEVLEIARRKRVTALVIDARWAVPNRPALAPWLESRQAPLGLLPVRRVYTPLPLVVYRPVSLDLDYVNPADVPHASPPQPAGPQIGRRDALMNAAAPRLVEWASLWRTTLPGFAVDSLWRVGAGTWRPVYVRKTQERDAEDQEPYGDLTFQILGIPSPDGRRVLLIDDYQSIEPAGDSLQVGGEPDSQPLLLDTVTRTEAILVQCGTPCGFHWATWLSPLNFALGGWREADDYSQWKQGTLTLYSLSDSTAAHYVTRVVSAEDYRRYEAAWHGWLLRRLRALRAQRPAS